SIEQLTVEDEPVQVPPRFDLQRYWDRASREYEARMQAGRARVRARPDALRPLARMSHAMAQAVARAGPLNHAGWHEFEIPIESVEVAVGDLLRLGPDVQALAPRELRIALRRAVAALFAVYGPGTAHAARPARKG
ncbi:MAG TPA: WYL domain-containing protein, partial [Burkholderiaceae bacterium]|nr:WYL domain-containing protein [Burkholderiaceae bacterium]